MPIYEYECQECGHQFDTIQKISEKPLTECPKCGKNTLKKLVSSSAFQLKGTGWYETDFKHSNKKTQDKSDANQTNTSDSGAGDTAKEKTVETSQTNQAQSSKTNQE